MKNIMVKKYKLTISVIFVLLIIVFSACSSNSLDTHVDNAPQEYQEEPKIEITSISILSALDPIIFGKFPQTFDEEAVLTITKNDKGYYLGSDLEYYSVVDGKSYRLEDVVWDAYALQSGDILLVSRNILYSARFDDFHDYFEKEARIFMDDAFMFTTEELLRIKVTNVKYEYRLNSSVSFRSKSFFLNLDQLKSIFPNTASIIKTPTDYAARSLETSDTGSASWWIAPEKGKHHYISAKGSISNKNNTYIDTSSDLKIKYSYRGIVPAMIISKESA